MARTSRIDARIAELRDGLTPRLPVEEEFVAQLRESFRSELSTGLRELAPLVANLRNGRFRVLLSPSTRSALQALVVLNGLSKTDIDVQLGVFLGQHSFQLPGDLRLPRTPSLSGISRLASRLIADGSNGNVALLERFCAGIFTYIPPSSNHCRALARNPSFLTALAEPLVRGKATNKRGKFAEYALALKLHEAGANFEPEGKISNPSIRGYPSDVRITMLPTARKVNFALPEAASPQVLIQCAFYLGKSGGFEKRYFEEITASFSDVTRYNSGHPRATIDLYVFLDGRGFWHPSWDSLLRGLLTVIGDNFFSLSTFDTRLLPDLKAKGLAP